MTTNTILLILLSILIAGGVSFFQYFYKAKTKSKVNKVLAFFRFLSIFGILLLLINPIMNRKTLEISKTPLAVVVDNSRSIADLKANQTVVDLFQKISKNKELQEKFELQTYQFDDDFQESVAFDFKGNQTNIEKVGQNLKSIYKNVNFPTILISDGNQTTGNDFIYSFDSKHQVYPLVVGDTTKFLDLKVGQLNVNKYAFLKNKVFYVTYGNKLGFTFLMVLILGMGTLQLAKSINGDQSGGSQESYFYYVAHIGRFQFREEPTDFRFWESDNRPDSKDYQNWIKSGQELDGVIFKTKRSYNAVYREFLINDIMEHPFLSTRQFLIRCMYGHLNIISKVQPAQFNLGPLHGAFGFWTFLLVINSINLIVLAGVALFLFQEKKLIQYWIFWGITVALLVFHGLTYMEPRYIFPSKVALYVMSAAGLYRIHWIKRIINKISIYVFPIGYSKG